MNVTPIEDLPDLNQMEPAAYREPSPNDRIMPENIHKNIRPSARGSRYNPINPQSGMAPYGDDMYGGNGMGPNGMGPGGMPPNGMGPNGMGPNGMGPNGMGPGGMPPQEFYQDSGPVLNCLDVANHINSCPLCSKFYRNDPTVYILAIVVLAIICILLLKRVLNV